MSPAEEAAAWLSKDKSCVTNLLEFFENINKNVDMGNLVDICLDFQKTFDKVLHQKLQAKLLRIWVKSLLMD